MALKRIGTCGVDGGRDTERGGRASGAHEFGVSIAADDACLIISPIDEGDVAEASARC